MKQFLTAVHLSQQHMKDKFFPDKAIDLMDEAASKVSIENFEAKDQKTWPQVGTGEVQEVMQEWLANKIE